MNVNLDLIIKALIIAIAAIVGICSVYIGKYKGIQDNPVEKVAEEIIKRETGLDIELTPESKDEKGS